MKNILFIDLDGTIIDTCFGDTFPKGIYDMKFNFDVLDSIKTWINSDNKKKYVFIVSNQGGIENGFVNQYDFAIKMEYITYSLVEYFDNNNVVVWYEYCESNDKNCCNRKPNTGMLDSVLRIYNIESVDKKNMFMVGDASGLEGQFSDSDKKTAENFGIDYFDVSEFIKINNKKEW